MKEQFDKSNYSTVGRSSCLVHVQWMKAQSQQSNYLNACVALVHSYVCLRCVCGGLKGGGDLRPPSPGDM